MKSYTASFGIIQRLAVGKRIHANYAPSAGDQYELTVARREADGWLRATISHSWAERRKDRTETQNVATTFVIGPDRRSVRAALVKAATDAGIPTEPWKGLLESVFAGT